MFGIERGKPLVAVANNQGVFAVYVDGLRRVGNIALTDFMRQPYHPCTSPAVWEDSVAAFVIVGRRGETYIENVVVYFDQGNGIMSVNQSDYIDDVFFV